MSKNITRYELPASQLTPESVWNERRTFLKALGFVGLNAWPLLNACSNHAAEKLELGGTLVNLKTLNAPRNSRYTLDQPLTDRREAAMYTNSYEFSGGKENWQHVKRFLTRPWQVQIGGMVRKPLTLEIDDILKGFAQEERHYRHRCVETWAMAVPWCGFPLAELLKRVEPLAGAKYVRFISFLKRDQAPGQKDSAIDIWPYHEGLTIEEANNELAFLATGIYGQELPKQHGAPIRLVLPWKYGFKSIKSITAIELTDKKPETFWNILAAYEYGFWANVNPQVPHPRWSQANETMLGSGESRKSVIFNGYGQQVAHLYPSSDRIYFY